jgi:Asp-tRNA(Asn)/Glu-tRNA(Gln) amidotransferase A subunit family amidase
MGTSFVVIDDSTSPIFSIKHLSERIKTGQLSPTELIGASLDRIKKLNPILNAFITIIGDDELYKQARTAEARVTLGFILLFSTIVFIPGQQASMPMMYVIEVLIIQ